MNDVVAGLIVGLFLKVFFDVGRNAWLRRKLPPAALAWMTTRRLFGPKTDAVVAEMALEVSTHVVFDRLAVALAERSSKVFQVVADQASATLLDMQTQRDLHDTVLGEHSKSLAEYAKSLAEMREHTLQQTQTLAALTAVFETQFARAHTELGERLTAYVEDQTRFEAAVRDVVVEHYQAALDALKGSLQAVESRAQTAVSTATKVSEDAVEKLGDAVEADLKAFLTAAEDTFQAETQTLVDHVRRFLANLESVTRVQSEAMLKHVEQEVGTHASAARGFLDTRVAEHAAAVTALTHKTDTLVDDLNVKAQGAVGLVTSEVQERVALLLTAFERRLEDHEQHLSAHSQTVFADHDENIRASTAALFSKLEDQLKAVEVDVATKSEQALDRLHLRLKERMPTPFLPAPPKKGFSHLAKLPEDDD